MLTRRIVVCLDVRDGRVVKGVRFRGLRDVGDPATLAERYEREGADEIVILDVTASVEERGTLLDTVRRVAERLFIPLTVGGGIRSADDAAAALRAGADKVGINSAAVARPGVLAEIADRVGSQAVVASIDARRRAVLDGSRAPGAESWHVFTHGGSRSTGLDAIEWAQTCAEYGAGEILLTSIDADGARAGYDVDLTAAVAGRVSVPVVASGGAGESAHVSDVLSRGGADAALVAGILHDGLLTVADIKRHVQSQNILVRLGGWRTAACSPRAEN